MLLTCTIGHETIDCEIYITQLLREIANNSNEIEKEIGEIRIGKCFGYKYF